MRCPQKGKERRPKEKEIFKEKIEQKLQLYLKLKIQPTNEREIEYKILFLFSNQKRSEIGTLSHKKWGRYIAITS